MHRIALAGAGLCTFGQAVYMRLVHQPALHNFIRGRNAYSAGNLTKMIHVNVIVVMHKHLDRASA